MPDDPARSCCRDRGCPEHGRRGVGNPTACARHGEDEARRMLCRRPREARSPGREGTPPFGSRLAEQEALSVPGRATPRAPRPRSPTSSDGPGAG